MSTLYLLERIEVDSDGMKHIFYKDIDINLDDVRDLCEELTKSPLYEYETTACRLCNKVMDLDDFIHEFDCPVTKAKRLLEKLKEM